MIIGLFDALVRRSLDTFILMLSVAGTDDEAHFLHLKVCNSRTHVMPTINVMPVSLCLAIEETDQAGLLFLLKLCTFSIHSPAGKTITVANANT